VARLGSDEFAVLLPEASYEAASEPGHKIAASIAASMVRFPPVSVSVGVVWFANALGDFPRMLEAADALMYEVKQRGKKGVRIQRIA
jgi:diguanylate cyclase (GGDEF)-like protein